MELQTDRPEKIPKPITPDCVKLISSNAIKIGVILDGKRAKEASLELRRKEDVSLDHNAHDFDLEEGTSIDIKLGPAGNITIEKQGGVYLLYSKFQDGNRGKIKEIIEGKSITLGRNEEELDLRSEEVSTKHLIITCDKGILNIRDRSTNGTTVQNYIPRTPDNDTH